MDDDWADVDFSGFKASRLGAAEQRTDEELSKNGRARKITTDVLSPREFPLSMTAVVTDKCSHAGFAGSDANACLAPQLHSSPISSRNKALGDISYGRSASMLAHDRISKRTEGSNAPTITEISSCKTSLRSKDDDPRSRPNIKSGQYRLLSQFCDTPEDDCFESLSMTASKQAAKDNPAETTSLQDRLKSRQRVPTRRPVPTAIRNESVTAWQRSQALSAVEDLEGLSVPEGATLRLFQSTKEAPFPAFESDNEDWAEGSLGIRHAASRQARSARASTGSSNLSISISSAADTEDGLEGLELPEDLVTLKERFNLTKEKRSAGDTIKMPPRRIAKDDLLDGLILEQDTFVKVPFIRQQKSKQVPSQNVKSEMKTSGFISERPSRLPKPDSRSKIPSITNGGLNSRYAEQRIRKLESATDMRNSNADRSTLENKPSILSLRSVSGAPIKDGHTQASIARASPRLYKSPQAKPAFLPGGTAGVSSYHISALGNRNDVANGRPKTPSHKTTPPSKRRATASEALKQEAAKYCTLTHARAKTYGEGNELDDLDDLPTSSSHERRFQSASPSKLPTKLPNDVLDRHREKHPQASDTRSKHPASSLQALRHPTQPSATRVPRTLYEAKSNLKKKRRVVAPGLISGINTTPRPKVEKNMVYNPKAFVWEGNEDDEMERFDTTINSPPRPALISNVNGTKKGVQVVNGMVFDPDQMCWVRLTEDDSDTDPFEGFDDASDMQREKDALASSVGSGQINLGEFLVGEEFDVGPVFIRRQREEESRWCAHTLGWIRYQSAKKRIAYLQDIYDLLMDD